MSSEAVALGRAFVDTLNESSPVSRAARLRELVTPAATWWCDTGRDRAAGRWWSSTGSTRPAPLHGTLPMHSKIEMIERGDPRVALRGTWTIERSFGSGDVAVVEAQSDCVRTGGGRCCNRHAFIFEVANQGVVAVREYMDTLHAGEVLGTAGDCPGSFAPPARNAPIAAVTRTEELALSLWEPLAANDVEGFGAPFAAEGTWWTDTGTDRALGAFDRLNLPPLSYPLHGRIPIRAKLDAMRAGRKTGAPRPSLRVTPLRIVSQGDLAALEAESYCELLNGRIYQNRYAFVVEACADGIREVREYADTLHIAQTFSRAPAAVEEH